MPTRRILLAAAIAGCALCPPRGDALDSHTRINRPAPAASAQFQGVEAIRAACPGIDRAVASLRVDRLLPADWQKKASSTACADLDVVAQRYAGRPSSTAPVATDLRALALALQQPPSSSGSMWKRINAWMRRRLAPAGWLLKWFHSLPDRDVGPSPRTVLLMSLSALLLLVVAALVLVGLRAAGLIGAARRRPSQLRRRFKRVRKAAGTARLGDDAEPMYAADRPVLALRMLMEALRCSRRIEGDGRLTCRELVVRALFDTAGQREGFAAVALLAERELYGPEGSSIDMPDELRLRVQALYGELLAAPRAARTALS